MSGPRELSFGALLRHFREAAGLTQEELAERAGLTPNAVGALERGERQRPYLHTVQALATALQLSEADQAALHAARRRVGEPPATAPPRVVTSLPIPPTPLLGRERDLAALRTLLGEAGVRLITLTGPGGVGKTRIALEVIREADARFPDGTHVVPLAPLGDPALVLSTLAHTLGVRITGEQAPSEMLATYLRDKHLLLLLDNFEHLLDAARDLAVLIAQCPGLKVIVTSRAPLRIRGEREYPVGPLAIPALDRIPSVAQLEEVASVRLFVERARAAQPAFALTRANAATVATICRRLDGLPLAIELAAARVKVLNPTELLHRLDRALPLLTVSARDLPERQRTLRDTIAWSYGLLEERERILFRRLAPFAGGWTLEAAEVVCNADGDLGTDVIDVLAGLVEKSLVHRDERVDEVQRFTMLETIREYAAEQIAASGEDAVVRRRHAIYYLALASESKEEHGLWGVEDRVWLTRMEAEHDNLRAALIWSRGADAAAAEEREGHSDIGLDLALTFWGFWVYRGLWSEGRAWLAETFERAEKRQRIDMRTRAKVLFNLGVLDYIQGDYPSATVRLEESESLAREQGDDLSVAKALIYRGLLVYRRGRYSEARTLLAKSVAHCRALGNPWWLANAIFALGEATQPSDVTQAQMLYEESAELFRSAGATWGLALPITSLGRLALARGEYATARALFEEGLALRRVSEDYWWQAISLNSLGEVARCEGEHERATAFYEEGLAIYRALGRTHDMAWPLRGLGYVALAGRDLPRAVRLLRESLALERDVGRIPDLAACLAGLAGAAALVGNTVQAAWLFGAAEALFETIGATPEPADGADQTRLVAAARAQLPEAAWHAAWEEGRALPLEAAIASAIAVHPSATGGSSPHT